MSSVDDKALLEAGNGFPQSGGSGKPVEGHNEYRCERFAELDQQIAQDESAQRPILKRKKPRRKRANRNDPLDADVQRFIDLLKEKYPTRVKHRSQAFKQRVLGLVRVKLPPYPKPKGRPPGHHLAQGARAYLKRRQEKSGGRLTRAEWKEIAQAHHPVYRSAKSNWRRESLLRTYQNSVYKAAGRLS